MKRRKLLKIGNAKNAKIGQNAEVSYAEVTRRGKQGFFPAWNATLSRTNWVLKITTYGSFSVLASESVMAFIGSKP